MEAVVAAEHYGHEPVVIVILAVMLASSRSSRGKFR